MVPDGRADRADPGPHADRSVLPIRGNGVVEKMAQKSLDVNSWIVNAADTYQVAQETGLESLNNTPDRWNVYGTDLGHMFLYDGRMFMVFGDTFGPPAARPFLSVPHSGWRSNAMAEVDTTNRPTGGLVFSSMITDGSGHARELLPSRKIRGKEQAVIPTYGVSVENRMYLYYMSIRQFDQPGHWSLNHSGVAYSDDAGSTWTTAGPRWPGNSNFGQVALVQQGGYIYVFGIPGGRYGSLRLARVPATSVLTGTAYQYWNGSFWATDDPGTAVNIVAGPVGELSVQYNFYYQKWLMMYLIDPAGQIVLRMADSLTGPWSSAQVVVTGVQYPQLYAPYITPLWNDRKDIYFTMSMFEPYQVFLLHTSLTATQNGG